MVYEPQIISVPRVDIAQHSIPVKRGKLASLWAKLTYGRITLFTVVVLCVLLPLIALVHSGKIKELNGVVAQQKEVNTFLLQEIAKNTETHVTANTNVVHRSVEALNTPMHPPHEKKFIINAEGKRVEVTSVMIQTTTPLKKAFK